jgi:ankyrin repeat protein
MSILACDVSEEKFLRITQKRTVTPENKNAQDDGGYSLLMLACCNQWETVVTNLLKEGVDVHLVDCEGKTALHHAVGGQSSTIVQLLIDAGADVNQPDMYGNAPLHYCNMEDYNEDIVWSLLDAGADLDYQNPYSSD